MPELIIRVDEQCRKQIERFADKLSEAFQQPTQSPELKKSLTEELDKCGVRLVDQLRDLHSRSITPYTGRSLRSLRIDRKVALEKSFISYGVAVGYFPTPDDSRDTDLVRKVQAYFGGVKEKTWITGALLKGVPPGRIKAPVKGASGAFGGKGYSRLEAYLIEKRAGRRAVHRRTTKAGPIEYKYRGYRQDIWAIVRRWERRGIPPTPLIEDFYNLIVPKEMGILRANVANLLRRWFET